MRVLDASVTVPPPGTPLTVPTLSEPVVPGGTLMVTDDRLALVPVVKELV